MSIPQIIAAIGGTTVIFYILLAILAPSVLALITPLFNDLVAGVAALTKYLWTGFLFLSQSVPAMLLLVFVAMFAYTGGKHIGSVHTWHKVHVNYTLNKKPKYKETDSETNNIFRHPLELLLK